MNYQTKFRYSIELPDGRTRKKTEALLIEAETFGEAEAKAFSYCEDAGIKEPDVLSVSRSQIREVANPHFYDGEETAWIVTLEETFLQDDGKEKKLRYPVLFWSEQMPNASDKLVRDYCLQIDPEGNTMQVVGVKKSDIVMEV